MKQPLLYQWVMILLMVWLQTTNLSAQLHTLTGNITAKNIPESSFENPGTTVWTFTGVAGIANNSIPQLSNNPPTPFGNHQAYIVDQGAISQSINVAADSCFRLSIYAARYASPGNTPLFGILVDGELAKLISVDAIDYNQHISVALALDAGTHLISIQGVNGIVLVDNIQMENIPCWSDSSAWNPVGVPTALEDALIPATKTVVLDGDAIVREATINGSFLAANNRAHTFGAERVMVMGAQALWEWGHEDTPYLERGVITLRGDISQETVHPDMGSGFIGAMMGATLHMHGQPRSSWTQLTETADLGATSFRLKETMDWEIGDTVVIASTDYDCHQAEKRVISNKDDSTFYFQSPLAYVHYGDLQYYDNGTRVLDERAEVGLLNRNLKIQGDSDSEVDGFGGHVMVMMGSKAYISSVEFYRMGQRGILGRYPFHWHLTGNLSGQYVKNCVIHKSFNRVLTVHSSDSSLVEDNVAYDHIGNGYFLENGDELENRFIHNLGILTRAANPLEAVQPYDNLPAEGGGPLLRLPATFWITHPSNHFVGNVCGGSEGSGFWMVVLKKPIEGSFPPTFQPRMAPLGQFDDNRSHSTSFSNFSIDLEILVDSEGKHFVDGSGNYIPTDTIPLVNRFVSYKCRDRSVWMRTNSMNFDSCQLGDNGRGTFFSYNNEIHNSLYVGKSANIGTDTTWSANEIAAGRSLPSPTSLYPHTPSYQFRAHPLYDGSSGVLNCHFANFTGDDASIFSPNTAAIKSTVHYSQGLTFEQVPTANKVSQLFSKDRDFQFTTGLIDLDGSLDALTNPGDVIKPEIIAPNNAGRRVYESGFNHEPNATYVPEWEHFICPDEHYGLLLMDYSWSNSRRTPMYSIRSDGPATYTCGQNFRNQIPVMANTDFDYFLQFHRLPDSLSLVYKFLNQNDLATFIIPNMPSKFYISKVSGTINSAPNLSSFESGNNEAYYFENNTLYLRLKGMEEDKPQQYGEAYKYRSQVNICRNPSGIPAGQVASFGMPLADYETGLDTRAALNIWGDLSDSGIAFNASATPFDSVDDTNSFSITTDGDPIDEYVEYRLDFPRQVWSEFNNLKVHYNGPKIQVLLHDASAGDVHLGYYQPDACYGLDLTRLTKEQIDEVDGLVIRVYESYLGDLETSGLTATVDLSELYLDYSIELSDFHFDQQSWIKESTTHLNIYNGLLQVSGQGNNPGILSNLFKGNAPVDVTQVPSVVVRMRSTSDALSNRFIYSEWNGSSSPEFDTLHGDGNFYKYLYSPDWTSDSDVQRIKFYPCMNDNDGTAEIDYIRLTTCETCYDEVQNNGETGIDCGGPECQPCHCENGILDADEEAIDCGGDDCTPCSDLVLEHGIAQNVTDSWMTINTDHAYTNMVVVATPVTISPVQNPVVTRVRNLTGSSFELRVQNPGNGNGQSHSVHYVVVEEGVYEATKDGITMEAVRVNSSQTSASGAWVFENQTYQNTYTNPVVLGQVQSDNDANWSSFWASASNVRNNPPAAGTGFSVGKHVGEDNITTRADEELGYIVIESGVYTLDSLILEAGLGTDDVRGMDDALLLSAKEYITDSNLKVETAILSSAAMDGNDGGWPVLYSNNPIVNDNHIRIVIDEDDIADPERNHTSEQVAYLAIGGHSAELAPSGGGQPQAFVDLSENEAEEGRSRTELYPNPAQPGQMLSIKNANGQLEGNVELFDAEGRPYALQNVVYSAHIIQFTAHLSPGIYVLSYRCAGQEEREKLVILE